MTNIRIGLVATAVACCSLLASGASSTPPASGARRGGARAGASAVRAAVATQDSPANPTSPSTLPWVKSRTGGRIDASSQHILVEEISEGIRSLAPKSLESGVDPQSKPDLYPVLARFEEERRTSYRGWSERQRDLNQDQRASQIVLTRLEQQDQRLDEERRGLVLEIDMARKVVEQYNVSLKNVQDLKKRFVKDFEDVYSAISMVYLVVGARWFDDVTEMQLEGKEKDALANASLAAKRKGEEDFRRHIHETGTEGPTRLESRLYLTTHSLTEPSMRVLECDKAADGTVQSMVQVSIALYSVFPRIRSEIDPVAGVPGQTPGFGTAPVQDFIGYASTPSEGAGTDPSNEVVAALPDCIRLDPWLRETLTALDAQGRSYVRSQQDELQAWQEEVRRYAAELARMTQLERTLKADIEKVQARIGELEGQLRERLAEMEDLKKQLAAQKAESSRLTAEKGEHLRSREVLEYLEFEIDVDDKAPNRDLAERIVGNVQSAAFKHHQETVTALLPAEGAVSEETLFLREPEDVSCPQFAVLLHLQRSGSARLSRYVGVAFRCHVVLSKDSVVDEDAIRRVRTMRSSLVPGMAGIHPVLAGEDIAILNPLDANGEAGWLSFEEAVGLTQLINQQAPLGHSDWRLPTRRELVSLLASSDDRTCAHFKDHMKIQCEDRAVPQQKRWARYWTGDPVPRPPDQFRGADEYYGVDFGLPAEERVSPLSVSDSALVLLIRGTPGVAAGEAK